MATAAELKGLLEGTSLPGPLVDELVGGASTLWLMGEPADVLAGDLVLCHPALGPGEVRARVLPTAEPATWRVGVVTRDRPGLLAATAAALAAEGLSIVSASATTWPGPALALQRVAAARPDGRAEPNWDAVGARLRRGLSGVGATPRPDCAPFRPVTVEAAPQSSGRTMVTVEAPDRVGLLWALAWWLAEHGCNIEVARAESAGGRASGTFVVEGHVDPGALGAWLSAERPSGAPRPAVPAPWRAGARLADAALGVAEGQLRALRRSLRRSA